MTFAGHLWTIAPNLRHRLRPLSAPAGQPWSTALRDPVVGDVELRGHLSIPAAADELVVLVHGLGGSPDSQYMIQAAQAASRAGMSSRNAWTSYRPPG